MWLRCGFWNHDAGHFSERAAFHVTSALRETAELEPFQHHD
jgi:hypothetical protein